MGVLALLFLAAAAQAPPTADQVLAEIGLSAADKQRVLKGEFVTAKVEGVSDRDLAFAIAFLVKTTPEALGKQLLNGSLFTADSQVQTFGELGEPGSATDLDGLKLTDEEAKALSISGPGERVNLSTDENASFVSAHGGTPATQEKLRRLLLSRYEAYRTAGLAGIAPYDRGGGKIADVASDLRKATESATELAKHVPALHAVLLGYPQGTFPGLQQKFYWVKSNIRGKPTFVLTHALTAADGDARAFVRREFYVSTGYNVEQSVAGFLPVEGGTLVLYMGHAFTDQVAGSGGSIKRSLGGHIMADQMKEIFENGRKRVEH
jgi:hypothetical protein